MKKQTLLIALATFVLGMGSANALTFDKAGYAALAEEVIQPIFTFILNAP